MKIKVLSKKVTIEEDGKKKSFYRYFSPCMIEVIDQNTGKNLGIQKKNIEVHFTKKASKKLDDEKVFAIFTCDKLEDYQFPFRYEIKENAETGEVEIPQIWIREFSKVEPIPYKAKESTCQPILDEEVETEETTIE